MSQDFIEGVDVSHYQGTVNWSQVAAAQKAFAILKASEGSSFLDPTFQSNWSSAKAAGLQCGAYHYFLPTDSFMTQANNFVAALRAVGYDPSIDLPPAIDCEDMQGLDPATYIYALTSLMRLIRLFTGTEPMIYCSPSFWNDMHNPNVGDCPLWIAEYTSAATPTIPAPWTSFRIWQYSDSGSVSGIDGPVDLNRMPMNIASPAKRTLPTLNWF